LGRGENAASKNRGDCGEAGVCRRGRGSCRRAIIEGIKVEAPEGGASVREKQRTFAIVIWKRANFSGEKRSKKSLFESRQQMHIVRKEGVLESKNDNLRTTFGAWIKKAPAPDHEKGEQTTIRSRSYLNGNA